MPRMGGSYRVEKKGAEPVLEHRTEPVERPRARPADAPVETAAAPGTKPDPASAGEKPKASRAGAAAAKKE